MNNLLLYLALILLGGSVILYGFGYFIGWKIEKGLLLKLIKDKNYPFETIDIPDMLAERFIHSDFDALWFRVSCRKKSAKEKNLSKNCNWMFFCGLFTLGLTLYNFSPWGNVLISLFTAVVGTVLWFIIVNSLRALYVVKRAVKVYKANTNTEA